MSNLTHRIPLHRLAAVLVLAAVLAGCGYETGQTQPGPAPSPMIVPSVEPTVQATPTLFVFGPLIESNLDLRAGPESVPLELQIPSLEVSAPIVGVGLTSDNLMDSPRGPISDPIWNTAYWYRGGGVPGDAGTAVIAGHVNDPLGNPVIFADLEDLKPGDSITIHLKNTNRNIRFLVDEVKLYTVQESSDPAVLAKIYGAGPVNGIGPQPSPDGLSHLTLITCAGDIINGAFDQHTVVYATRSD